MFKKKLGAKIGLGFGLLLAIAVAVGLLAVWKMSSVTGQATMLSAEYVPEVQVANEIERHSLQTMYDMRGYTFTENTTYLEEAKANLAEVKKNLETADVLAKNSPHLVKLQASIDSLKTKVGNYEELVEKTVQTNLAINGNRNNLDKAAGNYMTQSGDFQAGQNLKFEEEMTSGVSADSLKERLAKVTLINDIIDLGNSVRLATWRAQAVRDLEMLRGALATFDQINNEFVSLKKITREQVDLQRIDAIMLAAVNYEQAMKGLISNSEQVNTLAKERDVVGHAILADAQALSEAGTSETRLHKYFFYFFPGFHIQLYFPRFQYHFGFFTAVVHVKLCTQHFYLQRTCMYNEFYRHGTRSLV
jgi:methyl-accepting chemotaxis protein